MTDHDPRPEGEVEAEVVEAPEGVPTTDAGVENGEEAFEVDLDLLLQEREEYLQLSRRLQADFENYKKRMVRQQTETLERAAESLVEKLLPVLDNFDLALNHGETSVDPIYRSLLVVLEGEGLERLDPVGKPFDPNEHEAVAHEEGDGGEHVVSEVLRAGYRWKGRLLRAAMVKVRG